mgnify:CR=1 FL=1
MERALQFSLEHKWCGMADIEPSDCAVKYSLSNMDWARNLDYYVSIRNFLDASQDHGLDEAFRTNFILHWTHHVDDQRYRGIFTANIHELDYVWSSFGHAQHEQIWIWAGCWEYFQFLVLKHGYQPIPIGTGRIQPRQLRWRLANWSMFHLLHDGDFLFVSDYVQHADRHHGRHFWTDHRE